MASILTALVRMYQYLFSWTTSPQCHQQRIQNDIFRHSGLHRPANDFAGEQIDDHCKIKPAFMRPAIRNICHPVLIRCNRIKLPLESVRRHNSCFALVRSWTAITHLSFYSSAVHQTPDPVCTTPLTRIAQI